MFDPILQREVTSDEYFTPDELISKHVNDLDINEKYIDNEDYKNGNWVFEYIMTGARMTNQYGTASAYGNRFDVETNDKCQITKKYFILKIKSSWNSI